MLLEPVGKRPDPAMRAGFIPRTSEDAVARQLLRPCFPSDREAILLLAFDGFDRLIATECAEGDETGRCSIPPRCWRGVLDRDVATMVMAHNHPSGIAWPSDADIGCTRESAAFLRLLGIELVDHLIFVESGHFSFRNAQLL